MNCHHPRPLTFVIAPVNSAGTFEGTYGVSTLEELQRAMLDESIHTVNILNNLEVYNTKVRVQRFNPLTIRGTCGVDRCVLDGSENPRQEPLFNVTNSYVTFHMLHIRGIYLVRAHIHRRD
jgi:hypothetical protein